MSATDHFVAVETGGTKTLCRIEDEAGAIVGAFRFPTGNPESTVQAVAEAVQAALPAKSSIANIGVASFGPIDLCRSSITYGRVLDTPKPGWRNFDLVGGLEKRFAAPITIDTDVNAAALAELTLGVGRGLKSVAYVTVGTGIGGGLAFEGRTLRGALHPEIGHLRVRRPADDRQESLCPYHDDCAEGLSAGPAIQARLQGRALDDAPDVRVLLEDYLGQVCAALVLAWSPQTIAMGGGVLSGLSCLNAISDSMRSHLGGYGAAKIANTPDYLVKSALLDAGLSGAMLMARASKK